MSVEGMTEFKESGGLIKLLATRTGACLPRSTLARLSTFLNYLYTGRWMKEHQFSPRAHVKSRVELTYHIAKSIADEEVLYLEFGVWKGDSMRRWSKLLRNRASRLHGFDSFEGLPEEWDDHGSTGLPLRKGHFSTHGALPQISDTRVKFFKGWFEETLPKETLIKFSIFHRCSG